MKKQQPPQHPLNDVAYAILKSGAEFVIRPMVEHTSPTGLVWIAHVKRDIPPILCAVGFTIRDCIEKAGRGEFLAPITIDDDEGPMPEKPAERLAWIQVKYEKGKLTKEQVVELLSQPVDGKPLAEVAP